MFNKNSFFYFSWFEGEDGPNALLMAYVLGRTYLDINELRKALDVLDALHPGLGDEILNMSNYWQSSSVII